MKKTLEEKLKTRLSKLSQDGKIKVTDKTVKVSNRVLFKYSSKEISYTKWRYFPSLKKDLVEEDFEVTISLTDLTFRNVLSSSNICKPPKGARKIIDMIRYAKDDINKVAIGGDKNEIKGTVIYITDVLYLTLVAIDREEGKDKVTRVRNRVAPFLEQNYSISTPEVETQRDYELLLQEIIASKNFSQSDIVALTEQLESGEQNEVVIEKRINKQAEWLLESIQTIIDEPNLTKSNSQKLGNSIFGFSKASIIGPENLMEKILTKYGQHIIFGVPALLNIKKYVISAQGHSKSQFDLLLINILSDIEVVELKRPDEILLDYDASRGKFYPSKTLGIAVAQSERYISALYRGHDADLKIEGVTIREYIESQISGTVTLSICRPKALIVIGTIQKIVELYSELPEKIRTKVTKADYEKNAEDAYKEIKASLKNIDITTYTELVEGARLRLQLSEKQNGI